MEKINDEIFQHFPDKLVVSPLYGGKWKRRKILSTFRFFSTPDSWPVRVPKGFVTDYASIPRIFWSILPAWGVYGPAAIIHDYLYSRGDNVIVPSPEDPMKNQTCTRKTADQLFEQGMRILGVGWIKRKVIYAAVRMFGGPYYNKKQKEYRK